MKDLVNKTIIILGSIRFWQVVAVAILQALISLDYIDSFSGEVIANAISAILGVSVTIGTLDSVAKNVGSK